MANGQPPTPVYLPRHASRVTIFPTPYQKRIPILLQKLPLLTFIQQRARNIAVNQMFSLIDKMIEIHKIKFRSDEEQVDLIGILALSQITSDICPLHRTQVPQYLIDDLIEPHILPQNIIDIRKQRMINIGLKDLPVLFLPRNQQSCLLKTIKFQPDRIG
jgi:hypothetical protein